MVEEEQKAIERDVKKLLDASLDEKHGQIFFNEEEQKTIKNNARFLWKILEKNGIKYGEILKNYGDKAVNNLSWQVTNAAFYMIIFGLIRKGKIKRIE